MAEVAAAEVAAAVGGGGGGAGSSGLGASRSGGGGGTSMGATVCKSGWVYNKRQQICVRAGAMNDADLYEQGRDLAVAGYYENALAALGAIRDKNDSMVLTMIGYSKRKMGDVDAGMRYYQQALAIDPRNVNTREYLGEGYISIGRTDLALAELSTIEKICGLDCEQYVDLASAIAGRSDDWTPATD